MKTILILFLLTCNYCIGQNKDLTNTNKHLKHAIDSLPIHTNLEIVPYETDVNPHKDNFMFADSIWINRDKSYYIFRYLKLSSQITKK